MALKANFFHKCDKEKVEIERYRSSLLNLSISVDERERLLNFYLFNAPIKKEENQNNLSGKSFFDYGWAPRTKHDTYKMESELLKAANNLSFFAFIKSKTIDNTLDAMGISSFMCVEDERAVLQISGQVKIDEIGHFSFSNPEPRMLCLFRHLRNAIAHNQIFIFENNFVLFKDYDGKKVSAAILLDVKTLLKWIDVIDYRGILK